MLIIIKYGSYVYFFLIVFFFFIWKNQITTFFCGIYCLKDIWKVINNMHDSDRIVGSEGLKRKIVSQVWISGLTFWLARRKKGDLHVFKNSCVKIPHSPRRFWSISGLSWYSLMAWHMNHFSLCCVSFSSAPSQPPDPTGRRIPSGWRKVPSLEKL